jgi:hypothetical protein
MLNSRLESKKEEEEGRAGEPASKQPPELLGCETMIDNPKPQTLLH